MRTSCVLFVMYVLIDMCKSTPCQNGSERFLYVGASSSENGSERFFLPVNLRTVQNGSRTITDFEQDTQERFRTVPCFSPRKVGTVQNGSGCPVNSINYIVVFFQKPCRIRQYKAGRLNYEWIIQRCLGKNILKIEKAALLSNCSCHSLSCCCCGRLAPSPPGRHDKKHVKERKPPR